MGLVEVVVAVLAAVAATPLAFFLPACPCCDGCPVDDGKPRTDPKNEGTWVPSGTWRGAGGVTWSFVANPGDESGETWFFYGSASTSKPGGGATIAERLDWGNICNWYSSKTTSPKTTSGLPAAFDKRATRLPPGNAIIHAYSQLTTANVGPQVVKHIYFWGLSGNVSSSTITTTTVAHDSDGGAVFNGISFNVNSSVINGGATFNDSSRNLTSSIVNDGATFNDTSQNSGDSIVNGGATFRDESDNIGGSVVNDGAVFYENSLNAGSSIVNDGATFNDNAENDGTVNDGATFNDSSINGVDGTVNGGATFNDTACSERTTGDFFNVPCDRKFVAHPTDLPVCNGTAPGGCANSLDGCGCG